MFEKAWNFASVEAGSRDIVGSVAALSGLLAEGSGSLTGLAAVWGGTSSPTYQQLQARWDSTSEDLNAALQELAHTITESS